MPRGCYQERNTGGSSVQSVIGVVFGPLNGLRSDTEQRVVADAYDRRVEVGVVRELRGRVELLVIVRNRGPKRVEISVALAHCRKARPSRRWAACSWERKKLTALSPGPG